MSKQLLILSVFIWIVAMLFSYYVFDLFILPILLTTFTVSIIQIIKLIRERKNTTQLRLQKNIIFIALFLLTFFWYIPNSIIEKMDWYMLYNKRMEIVSQIEPNKLTYNTEDKRSIYKLPFDFPVISNGGNELIVQEKDNNLISITFFISRNFFDVPSNFYIYTKNKDKKEYLENYISKNPDNSWKVEENWYRINGYVSMAYEH